MKPETLAKIQNLFDQKKELQNKKRLITCITNIGTIGKILVYDQYDKVAELDSDLLYEFGLFIKQNGEKIIDQRIAEIDQLLADLKDE